MVVSDIVLSKHYCKKYLRETVDLCLYGNHCLQEETARDYFDWLVKAFEEEKDYQKVTAEMLRIAAQHRWERENIELKDQKYSGVISDYFEDEETLEGFKNEFEKVLHEEAKDRNFSKEEVARIRMYFDYYCDCFKYGINGNRWEGAPPNPVFSKKVTWKGKDSSREKKSGIVHRFNNNHWIKEVWKKNDYYQTVSAEQDTDLSL